MQGLHSEDAVGCSARGCAGGKQLPWGFCPVKSLWIVALLAAQDGDD